MENVLPRYKRPIANSSEPMIQLEHWEQALDAFDEKDFKKSIIEVINYINPKLLKNKNTDSDIEIIQAQGSAEVQVKITNDTFSVKAPFLKITDQTNKVALLRKVAEINFSPLQLAQIQLRENELWFEYEMPIELAQPNKVYNVLRNVCVYVDDYDDMFVEKYKADFYQQSTPIPLSANQQDEVWAQISMVFEDYKNYTQFFIEKRWENFQWDNLVISLMKISNMPYVNGKLRSDLVEYISNLFNPNIDFNFRVDKGNNFMKKLTEMSREEIMKNVYFAEQFIALRWRSSEQIISDKLQHSVEQVEKYIKADSNFNLSYYLQFTLLKLIYDYNLEESYKKAIEDVMEEVAGLAPNVAAPILTKAFYNIKDGKINNQAPKKKKGFFSSLFS